MWQSKQKPDHYTIHTASIVLLVFLAVYQLVRLSGSFFYRMDGAAATIPVWICVILYGTVIVAACLTAQPKPALRIAAPGVKNIVYSLLLAVFLLLAVSVFLQFLSGWILSSGGNVFYSALQQALLRQPLLPRLLFLCLLLPVAAVTLFFGMAQNAYARRFGKIAFVLAGLLFGLASATPVAVVGGVIVGIALGYVYQKTRSLWCPLLLFSVYNLLSVTGIASRYVINLPWSLGLFPTDTQSPSEPSYMIYTLGIAMIGALMVCVLLWLLNHANPDNKAEEDANDAPVPGEWGMTFAIIVVLALNLGLGIAISL